LPDPDGDATPALPGFLAAQRPAGDFAPLVGISKHTLYAWKKRFEAEGPAGLEDHSRKSQKAALSQREPKEGSTKGQLGQLKDGVGGNAMQRINLLADKALHTYFSLQAKCTSLQPIVRPLPHALK
jgi:hypothetical protein